MKVLPRDKSIIVLILLLLALVAGISIVRPGTVTPDWIANTLLFAAPLGLMAGGETLVLLTGGIDLSRGKTFTTAAGLMSQTRRP